MDFCSEISFFFHIPDPVGFYLLLLWHWQAYWILPLPRILLWYWFIYIYACFFMGADTWKRVTSSVMMWSLCSASGANIFCCAYCQAPPAALVPSPSPVASLSTWNHLISSRTDGDTNFSKYYSSMLWLHAFRVFAKTPNSYARTETKMWGRFKIIDYRKYSTQPRFILSLVVS